MLSAPVGGYAEQRKLLEIKKGNDRIIEPVGRHRYPGPHPHHRPAGQPPRRPGAVAYIIDSLRRGLDMLTGADEK
jgi:hypothetical protein